MITHEELKKSHGKKVVFSTNNNENYKIKGSIFIDMNNIFVLSNDTVAQGATPDKKLPEGYQYSWHVSSTSKDRMVDNLSYLEFLEEDKKTKVEVIPKKEEVEKDITNRVFYYSRTYKPLIPQLPNMRMVMKFDMNKKTFEFLVNGEDATKSHLLRFDDEGVNFLKLDNAIAAEIGLDFICFEYNFGVSPVYYDIENPSEGVKLIDGKSKEQMELANPSEEMIDAMKETVENIKEHYAPQEAERQKDRADKAEEEMKETEKQYEETRKELEKEKEKTDDTWQKVIGAINGDDSELKKEIKGVRQASLYAKRLSEGELINRIADIKNLMDILENAGQLEDFAKTEKLQVKIFKKIVEEAKAFDQFSDEVNNIIFK